MSAVVSMVVALAALQDTIPTGPCVPGKGAGIEAFVVVAPSRMRAADSLVRATVCVVSSRPTAKRIGSYHGELTFDSTAARVASIVKPADGMRVENTTVAGRVRFAGAAPTGFSESALLTIQLRLSKPGVPPKLRLQMRELNGTDGTNLMSQLVTSAAPRP